jgi:hypothetical protein
LIVSLCEKAKKEEERGLTESSIFLLSKVMASDIVESMLSSSQVFGLRMYSSLQDKW